jgi:hypothetical protein
MPSLAAACRTTVLGELHYCGTWDTRHVYVYVLLTELGYMYCREHTCSCGEVFTLLRRFACIMTHGYLFHAFIARHSGKAMYGRQLYLRRLFMAGTKRARNMLFRVPICKTRISIHTLSHRCSISIDAPMRV